MPDEHLHEDLSRMSVPRKVYTAPPELRNAIQNMLGELMSQRLEVGLAPSQKPEIASRGGRIRQVQSQNPDWYRKFAAQFTARRTVPRQRALHDTLIKRREVVRVLQNLLGSGTTSSYAPELINAAQAYQKSMDAEEAYYRERDAQRPVRNDPNIVQQASDDELDDFSPF